MQSESDCPTCKGLGVISSIDFMKGKTMKNPCATCRGTGKIREAQTDGTRCGRVVAETFFWQELRDSKVIATLEIRIRPVCDQYGRPLAKMNREAMFKKDRTIPRLYCELVRMNTKIEFRKQGIMSMLLDRAVGDPKIEWVYTSWDDSTVDGRNFLIGKGYKQEGDKLIYEKGFENRPDNSAGIQQQEAADDQSCPNGQTDGGVHGADPEREAGYSDEPGSPETA
jgi:hypothetical protein